MAGSIIDATGIVEVGFLRLFRAARLIKLLRRSVSIRIFVVDVSYLNYDSNHFSLNPTTFTVNNKIELQDIWRML